MCSFSPHPYPPSFVSGSPLSLMKARKGICLTTSSSTETKIRFSLFLERHSTLFLFYLIWSLSCMDQSFPENFEIVDKTLMFLRKSFRYGKQKMNYFILKKLDYIQISEKTERKSVMTSSFCDMKLFICLSFFKRMLLNILEFDQLSNH